MRAASSASSSSCFCASKRSRNGHLEIPILRHTFLIAVAHSNHLDDMFADDEMDETAQDQAVNNMLNIIENATGASSAPSSSQADNNKVPSDDVNPAQGPLSEVSDDSVQDSTSCEHSVCDGSSPEDDIEGLACDAVLMVQKSSFAQLPVVHPSQTFCDPVKPVAVASNKFTFPGGDGSQGAVGFGIADESCAYPQDSILDFPIGAENDANVFDHVVDMEGVLCLD